MWSYVFICLLMKKGEENQHCRSEIMAQILINIDDNLLSLLLGQCNGQGSSLEQHVNILLRSALSSLEEYQEKDFEDIFQNILDRVQNLEQGTKFTLTDICIENDWKSLGSGERKTLGKKFRKVVENNDPQLAVVFERDTNNKSVYIKK